MPIVKSFAVGNGDMFYIKHGSDSFTMIDCDLSDENTDTIIEELKRVAKGKGITRFICTHPDDDHFGGIERLDDEMPIVNFYVVENKAVKPEDTASFKRYRELRDSDKAFKIYKGCSRKWLNTGDDARGGAGIQILWPNTANEYFLQALSECNSGTSYNNISAVIRYSIENSASFMWLGDLETEFMENIKDDINLQKTTVVFAAHHGRDTGKIPDSWLRKLDPQFIVIGEAPSRHLNYYTGYNTITQNMAQDITFNIMGEKVHVYVSNPEYSNEALVDEGYSKSEGYVGSFEVETEYTL